MRSTLLALNHLYLCYNFSSILGDDGDNDIVFVTVFGSFNKVVMTLCNHVLQDKVGCG